MLGSGFGANFKLLADRTGNVGWMLFTGPELLAKFDGKPGKAGNYTMYNDPDGCMWSAYHWFNEYAGCELPEVQDVGLYFSPRGVDVADEKLIVTGSTTSAALIADRGLGIDFNMNGEIDVELADPSVVKWENNTFIALRPGETGCSVNYDLNGEKESVEFKFVSTPFPLLNGYFNSNIWETGSFDEQTKEFTTGTYGFAGWKYGAGLDLSDYNYLICEMETAGDNGLSLRLFDKDNYWTDPSIWDFNGKKRVVVDLKNMKSNEGRKVDPSHIYIIGFWTYGGGKHRIKNIFVSNDPNSSAVESVAGTSYEEGPVYNLQGIRVANSLSEIATHGIYIVNGKKIRK